MPSRSATRPNSPISPCCSKTKRIKRVPVVPDGKLVGIVSRANLVRALATTKSAPESISEPDDHAISDRLLADLKAKSWVDLSSADIIVRGGVVHLWSPTSSRGRRG